MRTGRRPCGGPVARTAVTARRPSSIGEKSRPTLTAAGAPGRLGNATIRAWLAGLGTVGIFVRSEWARGAVVDRRVEISSLWTGLLTGYGWAADAERGAQ